VSDPEEIAETLRELARLDLAALGQQMVLERIVHAAASCCGSTGGVGLLLLDREQQLCYVAAGAGPDAPWPVPRCDSAKAPRWTPSWRMRRLPAAILPASHAGPTSGPWRWRRASGRG
jgi:hypothetical protein